MMPVFFRVVGQAVVLALVLMIHPLAWADEVRTDGGSDIISRGIALRQQGDIQLSIDLLSAARAAPGSPAGQLMAEGELGISLLQARRYPLAEASLRKAHASSVGAERARYGVYLGNLAVIGKRNEEARGYYEEALGLAAGNIDVQLSVGLNLARLLPEKERLAGLDALSRRIARVGEADGLSPATLARHHLNLGHQARLLGATGVPLAYHHINQAQKLARENGDSRLAIEASDALAQLYEDQGRGEEALILTREAIRQAQSLNAGTVADLLIDLEWRQGRLLRTAGRKAQASAAYQRAVATIESIRQDIPIEYEDGRSSFRATLEPIYLGHVDLLLQLQGELPADLQARLLQQVMGTVELSRQAELQDFLGDRCSVEAAQGGASTPVPAGTAILYPLILPNRIELLLQTPNGIQHRTTPIGQAMLHANAESLADSLRYGMTGYMTAARRLYDWLLKPFEDSLAAESIHSLVVVPDGVLRLVPMAALHDGTRFVIEKYAVSMATGITMTQVGAPAGRQMAALVAGVSLPGPAVEKLSQSMREQILQPATTEEASRGVAQTRGLRATRSVRGAVAPLAGVSHSRDMADLRASLALPGVKEEIEGLGDILKGRHLLDAEFTVGHFSQLAASGSYRVVHIASHGVFGGSAETSFIMAYDDLLTLNGLQSLLKAEEFQKAPIELLSLSACQTAEGNDRAPLGIAGAAIKARARSVLGTLWSVDDEAAQMIMKATFKGVAVDKLTKTEALRRAQIELIRNPETNHPFFWAPFVLIGNWL